MGIFHILKCRIAQRPHTNLRAIQWRPRTIPTAQTDDPIPTHVVIRTATHSSRSLQVVSESVLEVLGRQEYAAVLLHQLGEVAEERVLLSEEVKLVVPLFPHHELVQEHGSVASHKLGSQLHYVTARAIQ